MSVLRAAQPIRQIAPRRHLRPVSTPVRSMTRPTLKTQVRTAPQARVIPTAMAIKVVVGLAIIAGLSLCVNLLCNSAVYQISTLKSEAKTLSTQSQILGQQVDSLRSPQNLSNSAKALGMVVNSNPVFLKIAEGKILGSAVPASLTSSRGVSVNRVANAALTTRSNPANFKSNESTKIDAPVTSVKAETSKNAQVVLPRASIPASPTH